MRSLLQPVTRISLIITLVVLVLILAAAGTLAGVYSIFFWPLGVGIGVLWLLVVFTSSFYSVEPDKMYTPLFLFSDIVGTYIPRNFSNEKDAQGRKMNEAPYYGREVQFIIALWPLYDVVIEPTTAVMVDFNLLAYSEEGIPVTVDASLIIFNSACRETFYTNTNVLSRHRRDLAEEETVRVWQNGSVPDSQTQSQNEVRPLRVYHNPVLAAILGREFGPVFMEAVRAAVNKHPFIGKNNVRGYISNLEQEVGRLLSLPESPLQKAGIFEEVKRDANNQIPEDAWVTPGISARNVDINITNIDVVDSDFRAQLTKPTQGKLEGERLRNIETESQVSARVIRGYESLDRVERVTVVASENPLSGIIGKLVGDADSASREGKKPDDPDNKKKTT